MADKVPELTPELVSDEIEVYLTVTASDPDGHAFVLANTDESMARQLLQSPSGDYQRCAAIVKVRVPRALLRERWKR